MIPRNRILAAALAATLAGLAATAAAAPQADQGAPLAEPSKSLYWEGHEALGRSDWTAALQHFRALERDLAASKAEPSDAAIYWQAYALSQARRAQEANAQVDRLRQAYPESAWLDDAEALVSRGEREDGRDADDDEPRRARADRDPREQDALMALDALLAGGNKKAVPLLQRVLDDDHSDKVKGRAIFVLSQIEPKAADESLARILQGSSSSRLKAEAIRMIAAGGRRGSLDRLLPIYRESRDEAVRRGVLDAFLIGDRGDLMLQVVQSETDPKRRHEAIEKLGAMGKDEQLRQLYAARTDVGDRRAVLRAMGIAGAHEALFEVARNESEPRLKAEAIRSVGIAGGKEAAAALLPLYQATQPEAVRKAVIEALMIAGASKQLVQLYRQEIDPELKRDLLHRISVSDSDAALELIDEKLRR